MEALNLLRHLKLNQNRYVHDVALYLWILVCFKFLLCNDLEALLIYTFEQQIFSYNFQVYSVPSSAKKKTGKDLISSHLIPSHLIPSPLHSSRPFHIILFYLIYSLYIIQSTSRSIPSHLSSHLISSHPISHPIPSHPISSHPISTPLHSSHPFHIILFYLFHPILSYFI